MLSDNSAERAINIVENAAKDAFLADAIRREIEQQERVYNGEETITNVLSREQEVARMNGKPFQADRERAKDIAETRIAFGVGTRLKGAYACYKAGKEMECIRHLMLAIGSLCCILGWNKAAKYIDEQNDYLFAMTKD